jgi:hypothetical protein
MACGSRPTEHREARRRTDREVAVRAVEHHRTFGQARDVRCLHHAVAVTGSAGAASWSTIRSRMLGLCGVVGDLTGDGGTFVPWPVLLRLDLLAFDDCGPLAPGPAQEGLEGGWRARGGGASCPTAPALLRRSSPASALLTSANSRLGHRRGRPRGASKPSHWSASKLRHAGLGQGRHLGQGRQTWSRWSPPARLHLAGAHLRQRHRGIGELEVHPSGDLVVHRRWRAGIGHVHDEQLLLT